MTESSVHPLVASGRIFLAAGVYDPLSAKLAERAGFKTVVLSGYAVAAITSNKNYLAKLRRSQDSRATNALTW